MTQTTDRIPLLDVLRGFALVCIMLDHIPNGVLATLTLSKAAFFDAAELFVILAGFLVGALWGKIEARQGLPQARFRFYRRAAELYQSYLVAAIAVALLSAGLIAAGLPHGAIWPGFGERLIETPHEFLATTASFWQPPNLVDVLALYVVLLAVSPLAMPLLRARPLLFAALSLTLWAFAKPLNGLIPSGLEKGGLLFNPFAWQVVFFAGAMIATFRDRILAALAPLSGVITALAWIAVAGGLFYAVGRDWEILRETALWQDYRSLFGVIHKWSVDEARFVELLAACWLVGRLSRETGARIAQSAPGRVLSAIGRQGLACFALGVLLSVGADAVGRAIEPAAGQFGYLAVDILALGALALAGVALDRGRGATTVDWLLARVGRMAAEAVASPEVAGKASAIAAPSGQIRASVPRAARTPSLAGVAPMR